MHTTGPRAHVVHEVAEEGLGGEVRVVLLRVRLLHRHHLEAAEEEALGLEVLDDRRDETALDAVGHDHDVGLLHYYEGGDIFSLPSVPTSGARRPPSDDRGAPPPIAAEPFEESGRRNETAATDRTSVHELNGTDARRSKVEDRGLPDRRISPPDVTSRAQHDASNARARAPLPPHGRDGEPIHSPRSASPRPCWASSTFTAGSGASSGKRSRTAAPQASANTTATVALVRRVLTSDAHTHKEGAPTPPRSTRGRSSISMRSYAIARKATLTKPKDLPVPEDKFEAKRAQRVRGARGESRLQRQARAQRPPRPRTSSTPSGAREGRGAHGQVRRRVLLRPRRGHLRLQRFLHERAEIARRERPLLLRRGDRDDPPGVDFRRQGLGPHRPGDRAPGPSAG